MPKSQILGPFPPIENIFFCKKNFLSFSIHQKPLKKHWDIWFWELLQFSTLPRQVNRLLKKNVILAREASLINLHFQCRQRLQGNDRKKGSQLHKTPWCHLFLWTKNCVDTAMRRPWTVQSNSNSQDAKCAVLVPPCSSWMEEKRRGNLDQRGVMPVLCSVPSVVYIAHTHCVIHSRRGTVENWGQVSPMQRGTAVY